MRKLKASSLVEAIVAGVIFLMVFAVAMDLLPRFTVRNDDTLLLAEADYHVMRAYEKYTTGEWPCGEYEETYDWGGIRIRITPYRDLVDVQQVEIAARASATGKRIRIITLAACDGQ